MNAILKFTASKIKPCPSTLIIAPTQTILRLVREELAKSDQKLTQLQLIADCIPLHVSEKVSVLGPIVGTNTINLALQPLLLEKIKSVYLISVAGSSTLKLADIFQGNEFINENNESYLANTELDHFKSAKVLTVNDPYTENADLKGCDLVEMEAAEIAKLCLRYNVKFYSLFCVSDFWKDDNTWQQGFGSKDLNESLKSTVKSAVLNILRF